MEAVSIFCDATLKAAILHGKEQGVEFDAAKLSEVSRKVLKANIANVMEEWKQATEARLNEMWLREMMNAQANELALAILKEYTA